MKIEIKHKISGSVLFSCEAASRKMAVSLAIEARADLSRADLSRADLSWADLSRADLSRADLSRADLSRADLSWADLSGANLSGADLSGADLAGADLSGANLSGADLAGANLSGADLDYACWPLWCGSKKVKVDAKIATQLAAHFCAVECEDKEYQKARKAILQFAMKSHRAGDLNIGETK
jgi:uncharacterized protein YjbI with pentapeptide repeats